MGYHKFWENRHDKKGLKNLSDEKLYQAMRSYQKAQKHAQAQKDSRSIGRADTYSRRQDSINSAIFRRAYRHDMIK